MNQFLAILNSYGLKDLAMIALNIHLIPERPGFACIRFCGDTQAASRFKDAFDTQPYAVEGWAADNVTETLGRLPQTSSQLQQEESTDSLTGTKRLTNDVIPYDSDSGSTEVEPGMDGVDTK